MLPFSKLSWSLKLLWICSLSNSPYIAYGLSVQPKPPVINNSVSLRNATLDDVDEITNIYISAFESNALHQYIYQFRHEYPRFHFECIRNQVLHMADLASRYEHVIMNVIDQPDDRGLTLQEKPQSRPRKAVSIALWALLPFQESRSSHTKAQSFPLHLISHNVADQSYIDNAGYCSQFDCSKRLDQNISRADYTGNQVNAKVHEVFEPFGRYWYLGLLATHPEWDGHGFAASQLQWGLNWARDNGFNTTLGSTPAGYSLYHSFGFEDLQNLTISALPGDDKGPFWLEAMFHEP